MDAPSTFDRPIFHVTRDGIRNAFGRYDIGDVRWTAVIFGGALTFAIFVVDLMLPLGIAGGIPYIAPVLMAMWLPDRRLILAVAALCSGLVILGLGLSPQGAEMSIALANRILAVVAIWTVAILTFQRRIAEGALAQTEAMNRAVLATTADGILTLNAEGTIISGNPALEQMFGYADGTMLGLHLVDLLDDEYAALFSRGPERFLQPSTLDVPPTHEMDGKHRTGRRFPIEVVFVPVRHNGGVRYTVTVRDITDRRLLERHLLRASDQERRAISHSLHEELGQALTGVSLISRQLARRLESRDLVEARDAAELASLLQQVDQQALRFFQSISPLDSTEHFHDAIAAMASTAAAHHGSMVTIDGEPLTAPADQFRAAQLFEILKTVVTGLIERGEGSGLRLETGTQGDECYVHIHVEAVSRWMELLRPIAYRAKLVEARLELSDSENGDRILTCRWSCRASANGSDSGLMGEPARRHRAIVS